MRTTKFFNRVKSRSNIVNCNWFQQNNPKTVMFVAILNSECKIQYCMLIRIIIMLFVTCINIHYEWVVHQVGSSPGNAMFNIKWRHMAFLSSLLWITETNPKTMKMIDVAFMSSRLKYFSFRNCRFLTGLQSELQSSHTFEISQNCKTIK